MIKQDFYIANLIARYLSEEITPEETIKLTTWREESTAHEILFKKICDEENQKPVSYTHLTLPTPQSFCYLSFL